MDSWEVQDFGVPVRESGLGEGEWPEGGRLRRPPALGSGGGGVEKRRGRCLAETHSFGEE